VTFRKGTPDGLIRADDSPRAARRCPVEPHLAGIDVESTPSELPLGLRNAHARGPLDRFHARFLDELPPYFNGAALRG
jgi:hypothetical protein